jgi:hypothetical protein
MKCFEQSDFLLEDKLKEAKFAIDDIIDSKPPQKLIRELVKVEEILETQIIKAQAGQFD